MTITQSEAPGTSPRSTTSKRATAERHDLGLVWIVCAIAGAAIIFAFNKLEVTHWTASAAPLLFMGFYVVFAMSRRQRQSVTRIADSVYFMGFWWTLWALLTTLVLHGLSLEPKTVFQAFGYALFTTAAGMFLRMSLLQFNRTLDDQETEAVDTIDEKIVHLSSALATLTNTVSESGLKFERELGVVEAVIRSGAGEIAQTVQTFVDGTTQALTEEKEKFAQAAQGEIAAVLTSLTELRKATERIQRSVKTHGENLDSSVGALSASLVSSAQRSKQAIESLLAKIDLIETPPDLIRRKVDAMTSGVETSLAITKDRLEATNTSLGHFDAYVAKGSSELAKLPDSLRAIDAALAAAAARLTALTNTEVGRVNAGLADLSRDVVNAKKDLGTIASGVNEMIQLVNSRLR